jgi:hypothetical protein
MWSLATNSSGQKIQTDLRTARDMRTIIWSWILALGLLLTGLCGGFAPWIWRTGVALQLTAPGLTEFVKFLPEVRSGEVEIERLLFLLPLFLAMLALPLFAPNQGLSLPVWLRWIMRLTVVPLALISLSPVWTPEVLRAPEFRLQTSLAIIALGLAVFAGWFKTLPLKPLVVGLVVGGAVAIIWPIWQFSLIQGPITNAYREPVSLGWGWWLTVSGIVASIAAGIVVAFIINSPENEA